MPLFKDQMAKGIITITDERMTRFWMTLQQGVEFVINCIGNMHGGEIFVPKIPSMKVVDLSRVIAPRCKIKYIGIRPGEKIHEVLLTEDEARHSFEFKDFFVIKPKHYWWKTGNWKGGKGLSEGFRYTSDKNHRWLTGSELKKMASNI